MNEYLAQRRAVDRGPPKRPPPRPPRPINLALRPASPVSGTFSAPNSPTEISSHPSQLSDGRVVLNKRTGSGPIKTARPATKKKAKRNGKSQTLKLNKQKREARGDLGPLVQHIDALGEMEGRLSS